MDHVRPPSGPANALRSPVYADNMPENGMLTAKVEQVMQASGGYYDNLPDDIQRMVHMYMDWQRVTPHTHFHQLWKTYVANVKRQARASLHQIPALTREEEDQLWKTYVANRGNQTVRAFFDGLAEWRKKDLLQMALSQGHPPGAESMPQANPYTITTR